MPAAELQAHGASICPPDSRMGSGTARVEVPVGGGVEKETATRPWWRDPPRMDMSAAGRRHRPLPRDRRIVIPSLLQPGEFKLAVPLVESLPEAADVSVVRANLIIGGNLTYYERRHGKMVPYRPKSVVLPKRCPRGG